MNIQPFQVGEKWVVAVNPTTITPDEVTGTRSRSVDRSRCVAESFWIEADQRWFPQHGKAVKYDSREECQTFIEENYEKLASTPIRL
jgi:hypothetical protein